MMEEPLRDMTVDERGVVRGTAVMGVDGRLVVSGLPFPDGTVVHALVTLLDEPESTTDEEAPGSSENWGTGTRSV